MSTKLPEIIPADNLSHGWGQLFLHVMDRSSRNVAPILLSVDGFDDGHVVEDLTVRDALDAVLATHGKYPSEISGMMIFPFKHWLRHGRPPRGQFFDWYLTKFLPRLKARDVRNRQGTYFERMINFQGTKRTRHQVEAVSKNQLDHIISIWHRDVLTGTRPRRSALQVSCFDPAKDHTGQRRRGFPCLQQVSFSYDDEDGLAVDAYYPTEYILDRAYGNYLGLAHLGEFMAHELGLRMVRLNCFITHPELGNEVAKENLRDLERLVRQRLPERVQ